MFQSFVAALVLFIGGAVEKFKRGDIPRDNSFWVRLIIFFISY